MASFTTGHLNFRITGPQSIERLEPLLPLLPSMSSSSGLSWRRADKATESGNLDFVWETACEKEWKEKHSNARVLNRLHNTSILEEKGNLAFLQLRMKCPTLQTYLAMNKESVVAWASSRWGQDNNTKGEECPCSHSGESGESGEARPSSDWWAVKASRGNGGRDVWIMNRANFLTILDSLPSDEYVIQQYVDKPLLWKRKDTPSSASPQLSIPSISSIPSSISATECGQSNNETLGLGLKKFHFRCYSLLRANMSGWLHEEAFILTAGLDFDKSDDADIRKHITNLSVNKRFANHPGQVPFKICEEYPLQWEGMKQLWAQVCEAVTPFMAQQRSGHHFDFFGIDIIADEGGKVWLIECNRLPGLESSSNNKVHEDVMYNGMMTSLLSLVTRPLVSQTDQPQDFDVIGAREGQWVCVKGPASSSTINVSSNELWKNTFTWKAFTRKNRDSIVLQS